MQQIMESLEDPEVRRQLAEEAKLDELEDKAEALKRRVDQLNAPVAKMRSNIAVAIAVHRACLSRR